ncbi:ENTPD4 [Cordylochernes scorpioides]|uniref:ENTPD4 n=1 Tax=Cordylochernes scorpioides TaxID=51811 RepID=A0ABY6K0G4_9ARAC|nr:ENTPD4 [Cordylochernes scorpioides]
MARHFSCQRPLRVFRLPLGLGTLAVGLLVFLVGLVSFLHSNTQPYLSGGSQQQLEGDYAVLVDAGSSGSRVYLYTWQPHSGEPTDLLRIRQLQDPLGKPLVKKIEPGQTFSLFSPKQALAYLQPLLEFASVHIPASKHQETPLFILATAGMRLLPASQQEALLGTVRTGIAANSTFLFSPEHVEIISGEQEGLYLWVALNYIMGRLNHDHPAVPGGGVTPTLGVLELGGASLQVAYEVANKSGPSPVVEINLGCRDHDPTHRHLVAVSTYLGLGANTAHSTYLSNLTAGAISANKKCLLYRKVTNGSVIAEPCLPPGYRRLHSVDNTTVILKGTGNLEDCRKALSSLVPHLVKPRSPLHFYGFSEFWYTMHDALGLGGSYQPRNYGAAAKEYCSTSWSVLLARFRRGLYPRSDLRRMQQQCFKSAWMMEVLHTGLGFPLYGPPQLTSLDKLQDQSVQWVLGALLYRTRYFPLRCCVPTYLAPDQHSAEDDLEPVEEVVTNDDNCGTSVGPAFAGTDGFDAG